mgnify:CR=1 FL=1
MKISDSVVMGDVQQNITDTICPACGASNVRVMMCQDDTCESKFCEICHKDSRHLKWKRMSFDSGKGEGPYCPVHLDTKILPYEKEHARRIEETAAEIAEWNQERDEEMRRFQAQMILFTMCSIIALIIIAG